MKLSHYNRTSTQSGLQLPMTSMIDVVFLLLIFFLVTSTFFRPERHVAAGIHVDESNAVQSLPELEPARIDVAMADDKVLYRLGANSTTQLTELKKLLERFDNKRDGAFIRVAPDVPFDFTAKTIGICRSAGFQTVSYISTE
jgi:biopolymer transport protein ExbD